MSKGPGRKFETGFKKQLVAQIESGQVTATQVARTHSISPIVISYWRKQSQAGELSEGPTRREKALLKEMEQYKKLLAEAHREIDLLKKQGELLHLNTCPTFGAQSNVIPKISVLKRQGKSLRQFASAPL